MATPGPTLEVKVRQADTNRVFRGNLEVDPEQVGLPIGVYFIYLGRSADDDESLSEEQAARFHFRPEATTTQQQSRQAEDSEENPPSDKIIADRLGYYAKLMEVSIESDDILTREAAKVLEECVVPVEPGNNGQEQTTDEGAGGEEETDTGRIEGGAFRIDMNIVWKHIKKVFHHLVSFENVNPTTMFTRLAAGFCYLYNFLKQLVLKYWKFIAYHIMSEILLSVASFLLKYLKEKGFKLIIENFGGWGKILSSLSGNTLAVATFGSGKHMFLVVGVTLILVWAYSYFRR